ncbi:unnamed protein product [Blepharisma stoltei]|uniref:Kelch motif family protein n=1 Tax=Blepharisma stoltei TaxID=1481888 RepID=A0AAU9I9G1_9CILI|nr:unnamed protein product [Blepharisma stoltei]
MNNHCFKLDCKNQVYGKCECQGKTLFCYEHLAEHVEFSSPRGHQCIRNYFKPSPELINPIIQKMLEISSDLKLFRNQMVQNSYEIIKSVKKHLDIFMEEINKIELKCKRMVEILQGEGKILDIFSENDIENILKLDIQQAQQKLLGWNKNLQINNNGIIDSINKFFEIPWDPFRKQIKDVVESKDLSFFRHKTKDFITVNLENFQITTVALDLPQVIAGYDYSCFMLPNKSYFYYLNGRSFGFIFIIDEHRNITTLTEAKINYYVDLIIIENSVYIIGGRNNLAEKYDMGSNKWERLASLPNNLNFDISCNIQFDHSILITGYYLQKIISYCTIHNKYKELSDIILQEKCYKIFISGNDKIYAIEQGGKNYESEINDVSRWNIIGCNNMPSNYLQSVKVRYKNDIYFVQYSDILWKFDLSSKQLSQIKAV